MTMGKTGHDIDVVFRRKMHRGLFCLGNWYVNGRDMNERLGCGCNPTAITAIVSVQKNPTLPREFAFHRVKQLNAPD